MPKTYANRIRAVRRLRGWRLADLAQRLDCDPSDLGKWERGEREPTLRTALRISLLLGERLEDLFWDHAHDAWARLRAAGALTVEVAARVADALLDAQPTERVLVLPRDKAAVSVATAFADAMDVVRPFPRVCRRAACSSCRGTTTFTQEKGVDTSIAVDLVGGVLCREFEVAVLVGRRPRPPSGCAGRPRPGSAHLRRIVERPWIAAAVREAADGHLDLAVGLARFGAKDGAVWEPPSRRHSDSLQVGKRHRTTVTFTNP